MNFPHELPPTEPPRAPVVTLVGAGPGHPDLLTVAAVKAIRRATVLLVDDLVGDAVLRYARPSTRIVRVGKRGGCRSTPQAFIERWMIAEARRGERVVRLKGGDPCLFGRAGEERRALEAAGLRVEVVNGITAGIAAATALGVPLTHRDHAHGVIFATGHTRDGAPSPDWRSLATLASQGYTLVIYMGVASAAEIERGLREVLPAATPVGIVQHASLPQERRVHARLGDLHAALSRHGLASPAIIVVGDVLAAASPHVTAPSAQAGGAAPTPRAGLNPTPAAVQEC